MQQSDDKQSSLTQDKPCVLHHTKHYKISILRKMVEEKQCYVFFATNVSKHMYSKVYTFDEIKNKYKIFEVYPNMFDMLIMEDPICSYDNEKVSIEWVLQMPYIEKVIISFYVGAIDVQAYGELVKIIATLTNTIHSLMSDHNKITESLNLRIKMLEDENKSTVKYHIQVQKEGLIIL